METDRRRIDELNVKLVNLKHQFSSDHPDVIKTKAEIAELKQRLKSSAKKESSTRPDNPAYITMASQLSGTQSEIATVNAQVRDLNTRLNDYKHRIELSPKVESDYKVLMMERNNTQAKYDDLMKKFMESKVSQGLEKEQKGERFTIIDPARLPEKPYRPNRPAIMLIGLVLGLGAGLGSASLKEFFDTTVHSASMLTAATSFPVLAGIPIVELNDMAGKNKIRWILAGIALLLILICGIIAFHFFVMDLDIFWVKLLRYLSF
jgi:polysaccharide biosynthesis transport protein